MTTTYSGPARLILDDGTRVVGMASLSTTQHWGIDGWAGKFRPDRASEELRNAADGLELELELRYDQIGEVTVTSVRKLLATQILMSLVGRGPTPF
jgi:hypothetical protein